MSTTLELYLGRDDEFSLTFTNPDGTAFDLEDCIVAVALKRTPDGDELIRLEPGDGVEITEPTTAGYVRFKFTRAAKAAAGLTDLAGLYWDPVLQLANGDCPPLEGMGGDVVVYSTITAPPS